MRSLLILGAALALGACAHPEHATAPDPHDSWRPPETAGGQANARVARAGMESVCGPLPTIGGRTGTSAGDYQCRTEATKRLERNRP